MASGSTEVYLECPVVDCVETMVVPMTVTLKSVQLGVGGVNNAVVDVDYNYAEVYRHVRKHIKDNTMELRG